MSDSFPRNAQRLADAPDARRFDRLTLALAQGRNTTPEEPVAAKEAVAESDMLFDEAMRGDFGPWTVSRSIDLSVQWPNIEQLQVNAGRLLALGGDERASKICWRNMMTRFPASDTVLRHYVALLAEEIGEERAEAVLRTYRPQAGDDERELGASAPDPLPELDLLLERALAWRRDHPPRVARTALARIVLIGGTLGGGGAERQLVNTALGLQARRESGWPIGPVTVLCRKLDSRRGHDFYLPKLEAAGIHVADYLRAEAWGGSVADARLGPFAKEIEALPPRMREGAIRLTEYLRHEAPDVVQIWQDGSILAAGLAALAANVPRIVLNVRTMPPSARKDRRRAEQKQLYRALLSADGVTLTANSHGAARAYEDWLDLESGSVAAMPNGVETLDKDAGIRDRELWEAFTRKTGHGFTLGGIMRLDANKRPLEWLEIAARLAAQRKDARYILIGAGPLRSAAMDYARRRGLADRLLLPGRTPHIGYWLSHFDALALTSRHEGLPNVLIEAQLAGVPVITTPAGGAAEAVAPNPANLVLSDAGKVPHGEAVAQCLALANREPRAIRDDADDISGWARDNFAIETMIDRTLALFTSG